MRVHRMLLVSLIINVFTIVLLVLFSFRYNLPHKVAEKLGWVDKTYPQDYRTVQSWNNTMESIQYEADVVFFGASITSDGKWHDFFKNLKICNLGKSGDKLETMLQRVPQITAVHPKKIFVAPEQNDMRHSSICQFRKQLTELMDSIINNNPQAEIYLVSLLPLNKSKFKDVCDNEKIMKSNQAIEEYARNRQLEYIDLYTSYLVGGQLSEMDSYDGQHLYPEAYKKWVSLIEPYIIN